MKIIYKGKYNGDPETIPHHDPMPNAKRFDEISDVRKFGIIMNGLAIIVAAFMFLMMTMISGIKSFDINGSILAMLSYSLTSFFMLAVLKRKYIYMQTLKAAYYLLPDRKQ